jgi:uncharacterized iron-regulated protein
MQLALGAFATAALLFAGAPAFPDPVAEFISAAESANIVIVGEIHDNPEHHRNQARIAEALQPAALVFEMIPQEKETLVNEMRAAGATRQELAEALQWADSGWPEFDFYADILEAVPSARVFGAGQPSADVRRAMVEGAAGPFGPDAAIYGLDKPLEPEEQAAREALQAEAHCDALAAELLPGMVEAQRFRDAGLADATLWARTMTGGGQIMVVTGNGHADLERGVPQALRFADPEVSMIVLGQLEAEPDADAPPPFDFYVVTEAPERDDPCAALID